MNATVDAGRGAALRSAAGLALWAVVLGCGSAGPVTSPFQVSEAPAGLAGPPLLVIACVGDTHANHQLEEFGDVDPLAGVAHLFGAHDVFLFNHEGIVLDPGLPPGTCPEPPPLVSGPAMADYFRRAPVTVATLANNHTLDCLGDGLDQTIQALEARGILTVGAAQDLQEACTPREVTVNGIDCAFLSYLAMDPDLYTAGPGAPGAAAWDACDGAREVAALKAAGKFVVVALHLHLGPGWTEFMEPAHRALAAAVLDAGADVVVAHGPHVPQGILVRGGGVAFLSLGNFLLNLDFEMPPLAHRSVLAEVAVHPDRLVVSLRALRLDAGGRPRPTTPDGEIRILHDIATLSADLGTDLRIWQNVGYVVVERSP
ncbi:MAG: CapA family protein [Planctomycetota bacterium]